MIERNVYILLWYFIYIRTKRYNDRVTNIRISQSRPTEHNPQFTCYLNSVDSIIYFWSTPLDVISGLLCKFVRGAFFQQRIKVPSRMSCPRARPSSTSLIDVY